MAKKGKGRVTKIPDNESKADRFVRVVTPRVAKAMKAISTIGFCASATYECTPAQSAQIISALTRSVDTLAKRFTEKKAGEPSFGFED